MPVPKKISTVLLIVSCVLSVLIGLVLARGDLANGGASLQEPIFVLAMDAKAGSILNFDPAVFVATARAEGVQVEREELVGADFVAVMRQARVLVLVAPRELDAATAKAVAQAQSGGVFVVAVGNLVAGAEIGLFVAPGEALAQRAALAAARLAKGQPIIAPGDTPEGTRVVPTIQP